MQNRSSVQAALQTPSIAGRVSQQDWETLSSEINDRGCAVIKRLDVTPATNQPGVEAALAIAAVGDKLIFAGQDIAAVAATRPGLAKAALASIIVEYEPRPFVVDTRAAMAESAPQVHTTTVEEKRTGADEPGAEKASGSLSGNVRPGRSQKRGGDHEQSAQNGHFAQAAHLVRPVLLVPLMPALGPAPGLHTTSSMLFEKVLLVMLPVGNGVPTYQ